MSRYFAGHLDKTIAFVESCLLETDGMNQREKSAYMFAKVQGTIKGFRSVTRTAEHAWAVGDAIKGKVVRDVCRYSKYAFPLPVYAFLSHGLCRTCFLNCYGMSNSSLCSIVKSLKGGEVVNVPRFRVNAVLSSDFVDSLLRLAAREGVHLTHEMVAMLRIPNSPESFTCYAWMHAHFEMIGDNIPNSDCEIHLEPISIKEVWQEYADEMKGYNEEPLEVKAFGSMWVNCFPFVKIREYKAVTGKCDTCAALSHCRRTFKDNKSRTAVKKFHALHRMTYMGERRTYAQRVQQSFDLPEYFMSVISDGMAQNHCMLPWWANNMQFGDYLPQHLQGLLNHGRGFTFFRTFHNIVGGGSFQLQCFLMELDFYYERDGKLPDTLFYQIDGGIENTAKTCIVMMELLVAMRLVKTIVLTRLPVGHTHADIDARFFRSYTML